MKHVKKSILIGASVISVGAVGVGTAARTLAVGAAESQNSSIIDAIAKKFNLSSSEVKKVFDEQHAAKHEEMKAERETALKQALTDNKIGQAQYDHIVAAWKEIDAAMEAAGDRQSQTDEQRSAIRTKMDALRDWMKEQNISPDTIGLKHPGGHGRGGPENDDRTSASDTTQSQ